MTDREIRDERLKSIRKRILLIRGALENPDSIINISIDGVSENWVSRDSLIEELRGLERAEDRLTGRFRRVRTTDLSKLL